ncbi:MAG: YidC/Oxa1 family membrane protein insertase [Candidatus Niyogibacteria bacterium]|nr:YidC/Oxa1 family membrane protein insertase [Candidatus Niyogibacteria bacterium]
MTYMMPVLIFWISLRFPAAVGLYWTTTNIFATLHEGIIRRKAKKFYDRGNGKNQGNSGSPSSENGLPGVSQPD